MQLLYRVHMGFCPCYNDSFIKVYKLREKFKIPLKIMTEIMSIKKIHGQ